MLISFTQEEIIEKEELLAHPEIDNNEAHDQSPRMERTDVTPPSVSKIDEHNSLSALL